MINVYAMARRALPITPFTYFAWISSSTTAAGIKVQEFATGVTVKDSIQAVDRKLYHSMGLAFDSIYVEIFTLQNVDDLDRYRPSDQIEWNGKRWQVLGEDDWTPIDGWNSFLAVAIKPDA